MEKWLSQVLDLNFFEICYDILFKTFKLLSIRKLVQDKDLKNGA